MEKVVKSLYLEELARRLGGEIYGENVQVFDVVGLDDAQKGHLTWVENGRALEKAQKTEAAAILISEKLLRMEKEKVKLPAVVVENPRYAFAQSLAFFYKRSLPERKVSPKASIGKNVKIGNDVYVGDFAVIGDNTVIGDSVCIFPLTYVGKDVKIGEGSIIYPQAVLHNHTVVGKEVIVHSGAVIGGDGFGFVQVQGEQKKIPQVGSVELCDKAEIGANVTIDRATTGVTRIGEGTKIDNLVQVGHNCKLGKNCIMVSQSGIAGSTRLGDNVTLAAQAGTAPHVRIGDNTLVAGRGGVTHDLPGKQVVSGFPAKPHREALKIQAAVQRLPTLRKIIKELESRIDKLEENTGK